MIIPIRDDTKHAVLQGNLIAPFLLFASPAILGTVHTLWLSRVDNIVSHTPDDASRLIKEAAFQKPLLLQTVERWHELHQERIGDFFLPHANMVGVYELLREGRLTEGDFGEVFYVDVSFYHLKLRGVYADSKGAAKRFLNQVCDEYQMEENYKKAGLDPARARDFMQL